jgi:hypothetical protein
MSRKFFATACWPAGYPEAHDGRAPEDIVPIREENSRLTRHRARLGLNNFTVQIAQTHARAMLADTYNWFAEGFDTADLKDAQALLDELGT